jgi:hypothetical protein
MEIINIHLPHGMAEEFMIIKYERICGWNLCIKGQNGDYVRCYALLCAIIGKHQVILDNNDI